ncbi:MAG: GNAT family N-acetyltransferase [bacterium]|jgi:aminoglycoside 6'-N-acetyltransferase I
MNIRYLTEHDVEEWLRMRMALWPHHDPDELKAEVSDMLGRLETQPVFVAEREGGGLCGMVEVSIRQTAEKCRTRNVGYLEGWYVDADMRRRGLGRRLVEEAEKWARARGCLEMASDTTPRYPDSPAAHRALGYEEVQRKIHFRKDLQAMEGRE